MSLLRLALLSLANRAGTAALTVLGIALSVALLLGVQKVQAAAKASFASTISGTDVIVGARTGDVQLLLYSVFRLGDATNDLTWESYRDIAERPEVEWIVPMSLGDTHRGYRVVGTTPELFERYAYRGGQRLAFADGQPFDDLFDAVIGAEVAEALGYRVGTPLVLTHGFAGIDHDDRPFRVSGVLARTGTPVDRAVHVSLEAITAIHVNWRSGAPVEGIDVPEDRLRAMDLTPDTVTAALVGLRSRVMAFRFQRFVNEYRQEPLTAILPGVTLTRLWSLVGVAERALSAVAAMVVLTALIGLVATLLATLQERRREMAILRANGARPVHVAGLLVAESSVLTLAGVVLGAVIVYAGLALAKPLLDARLGLSLPLAAPTMKEAASMAAIALAGVAAGAVPAWRAYRTSLSDGMSIRS